VIPVSEAELESHQKMAKKCFNEAWDYLDKGDRSARDEQQMLHLAHASSYHWSFVGKPANFAVSDWQISRVYAALNQPHLALQFAQSALETCQKHSLVEILISAYEGMARAYAIANDSQSARNYLNKARKQLGTVSMDDEDRKIYSDQIHETEQLIGH
jgi:cation transport regulator ChaB